MDIGVEEIDRWHKARGWSGVGYNWVIRRDGTIEQGRSLCKSGAHTKGYNNSIGICYVGGVTEEGEPEDNMTATQEISLLYLIRSLRILFGYLDLAGHNEFSNKACPSFIVKEKYKFLLDD